MRPGLLALALALALACKPGAPQDDAAGVLKRAFAYHGEPSTWAAKRTVEFTKTTVRYRADGAVESRRVQHHRYVLRPALRARIEWEDGGKKVVLVNDGREAWKLVDGQPAISDEDVRQARNSTFGSHYVWNMPWKLADPGAHLAYAGRETLAGGTEVDKVRVTYDKGVGDAGGLHVWTYYFDTRSGRLTANHLTYGPGQYDFTEYLDDGEVGGLRFAARRDDYEADLHGKRGRRTSEITYQDVRLDVPLEDALFAPPSPASGKS